MDACVQQFLGLPVTYEDMFFQKLLIHTLNAFLVNLFNQFYTPGNIFVSHKQHALSCHPANLQQLYKLTDLSLWYMNLCLFFTGLSYGEKLLLHLKYLLGYLGLQCDGKCSKAVLADGPLVVIPPCLFSTGLSYGDELLPRLWHLLGDLGLQCDGKYSKAI